LQACGPTKVSRLNMLRVIAEIATTFDVLVYQSVGSNGAMATETTCKAVMDTLVASMNGIIRRPVYSHFQGNQYAIVYNTEKVNNIGHSPYAGTQTFSTHPWSAASRLSEFGSTSRSWTSTPAPRRQEQRYLHLVRRWLRRSAGVPVG
jgi:hypothetical protein